MDKLVSIIIPVYGVEKYLDQCLRSVMEQTYKNLEIIVIDDESPDESGVIASNYSTVDSRIHVFHIKNRGAAGARNVGLENCSGDYVMFVDSDDWLECNAVEVLLNSIKTNECDIVQCSYYDEFLNKSVPHPLVQRNCVLTSQSFAEDMLTNWEDILLWNKLFSSNVVRGIWMEEGHCIDDEFFTYKTVIKAKNIKMISDRLYHYRNRKTSAMKNGKNQRQRLNDQIDFVTKRYEPLCNAYPNLQSKILQHLLTVLMEVMRHATGYSDVFARARKALIKYGRHSIFDNNIDFNIKKNAIRYLLCTSKIEIDNRVECKDGDNYFE